MDRRQWLSTLSHPAIASGYYHGHRNALGDHDGGSTMVAVRWVNSSLANSSFPRFLVGQFLGGQSLGQQTINLIGRFFILTA